MLSRLANFLDPDQVGKLKESTLQQYRGAAARFSAWAHEEELVLTEAAEWDNALVLYKNIMKERGRLTRSQFILLIASVEFFFPRHKGHLSWAHAVSNGWGVVAEIKHTIPMGKGFAKLASVHIATAGHARLAVGLVTQVCAGLRPSEMLEMEPDDLVFPWEVNMSLRDRGVQINVGPRTGTKLKRPQVANIFHQDADVISVLYALRQHTHSQDRKCFPTV
jgi:hypothetical protein